MSILRTKILQIFMTACIGAFALTGCGSRACGDAPAKNESATELAVEDSQTMPEDLSSTEQETETIQESTVGIETLEVTEWGLTLHAKNVTPEGVTIVCTQSGGSLSGELETGSYYVLEQEVQGVWCIVEYTEDAKSKNIGWTAEAWIIPMNDTVEWEVDWEWLYGSLKPGHYRIGKEITDFRGSGDYDKEMYYAEFEIKEL